MVRLKAIIDLKTSAQIGNISIPYGAIKRYCIIFSSFGLIKFQFLMVRLKGL